MKGNINEVRAADNVMSHYVALINVGTCSIGKISRELKYPRNAEF
jgi:hypothetical protein